MPLKEETPGLRKGIRVEFFLLFLLFSVYAHPQIFINGFCRGSIFHVEGNFTKLSAVNFNDDSHHDLAAFSPYSGEFATIKSNAERELRLMSKFKLPYPINNLTKATNFYNNLESYFFVSRQEHKVGLINFTRAGVFDLNNEFDCRSAPDVVYSADIDRDGKPEFLVSGAGFDGISLFEFKYGNLTETKIVQNLPYSQSALIDINYDGFHDIAAFNLSENALSIFLNDGRGGFSYTRSVRFNKTVTAMEVTDFDKDGYIDLIFGSRNQLDIFYGDNYGSLARRSTRPVNYEISRLLIDDFNNDGLNDVVYLSREHSIVSILFKKNEKEFFDELEYLKKKNLTDISLTSEGENKSFSALSTEGDIYTVSRVDDFYNGARLMFGLEPSYITSFDYKNDGIKDICGFDKRERKFFVIINSKFRFPGWFRSVSVFHDSEKMIVDDSHNDEKSFFLYKENGRSLEILKFNFNNGFFKRDYIYTDGAILDVKLTEKDNVLDVNVLYQKGDDLLLSEYHHNGLTYKESIISLEEAHPLLGDIVDAKTIYYWQNADTLLNLIRWETNSKTATLVHSVEYDGKSEVNTINAELYKSGERNIVTFIEGENKATVTGGFAGNDTKDYYINPVYSGLGDRFLAGGKLNNETESVFAFNPSAEAVYKLVFYKNNSSVLSTFITYAKNLSSFFVEKLDALRYYIIYGDELNDTIQIIRL